jgi:hypothetical protein
MAELDNAFRLVVRLFFTPERGPRAMVQQRFAALFMLRSY